MLYVVIGLLRRIARRCETHDRASHVVTSRLERQLGMEPSVAPNNSVDSFIDPELIDCGNSWCRHHRRWWP